MAVVQEKLHPCCFCHQLIAPESALGPFSFRQGEKYCHLVCAMYSNGVWFNPTLIDLQQMDKTLYTDLIKPLLFFPSIDVQYPKHILDLIMPAIMNIEEAIIRGGSAKCSRCKKLGASIQCNRRDCRTTCHYDCIRRQTSGMLS